MSRLITHLLALPAAILALSLISCPEVDPGPGGLEEAREARC